MFASMFDRSISATMPVLQGFELLNSDDHSNVHKKYKKDSAESRPDILHQCLLTLLDSPLNKAGKLQIYVETKNRTLIELSPHIRIPRTYKRFAGLMGMSSPLTDCVSCDDFKLFSPCAVQLMQKMKVKAAGSNQTLMKVIKNPVTAHLPVGAPIYGTHMKGDLVDPIDLVAELPDKPIVFVFGAMSKGFITGENCEKLYSFSQYPVSAVLVLALCLSLCTPLAPLCSCQRPSPSAA